MIGCLDDWMMVEEMHAFAVWELILVEVCSRMNTDVTGSGYDMAAPFGQPTEAFQSMIPQVERELVSLQPCFGILPS